MSCVFENRVENDVSARYAVRVPVITDSRKQGGTAIDLVPFGGRDFFIANEWSKQVLRRIS